MLSIVGQDTDSKATHSREYELRSFLVKDYLGGRDLISPQDLAIEGDESSVYHLFSFGNLLYVGATQHPWRRFMQHANGKPWWREVTYMEQLVVPSHGLALHFEDQSIRYEQPLYNRTGPWSKVRKAAQKRGLERCIADLVESVAMPI